jgi:UDP-glucose 4-epimerase
MKIVVTGATGHLGRATVAGLTAAGHEIVALSRSGALGTQPVDLTRDPAVDAIASHLAADVAVIHLAALHPPATASTGLGELRDLIDANVHGTMRVLEACRRSRCARVVLASTFEVYGDPTEKPLTEDVDPYPTTDYGATKLAAEDHVRSFSYEEKVPTITLRMPAVYGPGEKTPRALPNFLRAVARGERPTVYGDGQDERDQLYVDDAARALRLAVEADAEGIFNVADGERHTILSIARAALAVAGLSGEPELRERVKERRDCHMSIDAARSALGFAPATTLEEGMRRQLAWIRSAGGTS